MKTKCLLLTRYLVAALLIVLGVLLACYDVGANLRRGSEPRDNSGPDILRTENDDDPEYREQRREFLKRFFGNREGGVSAREYKRALAQARALPRSPLLEGRGFGSLETSESVPHGSLWRRSVFIWWRTDFTPRFWRQNWSRSMTVERRPPSEMTMGAILFPRTNGFCLGIISRRLLDPGRWWGRHWRRNLDICRERCG